MTTATAITMAAGKRNITQIINDYGKKLFSFIRSKVESNEDAEDVLQDVWFQLTAVLNAQPVEQVSGWLYRVAKNRIADRYRKADYRLSQSMEDDDNVLELQPILPDAAVDDEQFTEAFWKQLAVALEELPPEQREVFLLHEIEEMSFSDISELTGEKVNTLLSRKRYAVLHLRKKLQRLYTELNK